MELCVAELQQQINQKMGTNAERDEFRDSSRSQWLERHVSSRTMGGKIGQPKNWEFVAIRRGYRLHDKGTSFKCNKFEKIELKLVKSDHRRRRRRRLIRSLQNQCLAAVVSGLEYLLIRCT